MCSQKFSSLIFGILSLNLVQGYLIQPRILYGPVSDTEQYPFYVQLARYKYEDENKTVVIGSDRCGASLLTDR